MITMTLIMHLLTLGNLASDEPLCSQKQQRKPMAFIAMIFFVFYNKPKGVFFKGPIQLGKVHQFNDCSENWAVFLTNQVTAV